MKSNIKLVVVALTTLALAGCVGNKTKSSVESALTQQTAVLTKVAPVENVEVAQTVDFTTTLLPYKKTFITPQMALRIDEIRVDVGDHVKEGELVATLDRNQYNQTSAQLKNAKQNLARMRSVYEAGGVSRSQIDELETSVSVMEENIANLERNIELRSPIDGVITGRYNEPGDLFTMGGNADGGVGVLQVMQINRLKAIVALSEQYYPQVYKGMKVKVMAEVYPDKDYMEKNGITDIKAHLQPYINEYNKNAVSYKKIMHLKVRAKEFPKNTLRKIQRFQLDMTID